MKEYGQYVLLGIGIFIFICAITILLTWCNYRHDRDEDYQMYQYHSGAVHR